jgi:hypothetical protein
MSTSTRVTRWAEIIERAIEDVGAVRLDLGTMLAIVATESSGDAKVVNRFGFVGLFQIGTPYLKDARAWLKRHRPELLREVPRTKRGLIGKARASALVTAAYMRKYSEFHDWDPRRIAGIHKGGAGSAARLDRMLQEGWELRKAVRWIADHWRYSKGRRKGQLILGSSFYDYVFSARHFAGHHADYQEWAQGWRSTRAQAEVVAPEPEPSTPRDIWTRYLSSVWRELTNGGTPK